MGRLRNIGRLRAGGSQAFSPSSIAFTTGLWLDQSDISTGFTDSAGTTPQTATGQPTGKRLDKSGNANHVLQATAASRPVYTVAGSISSDVDDGVDDGYSTASFTAGSLVNGMDCFIAVKRNSAAQMVSFSNGVSNTSFFGVWQSSGSGVRPDSGAGTPTYAVNGVGVAADRALLDAAVTNGSWVVLEVLNLNLSLWVQLTIGSYAAFYLNAGIGGVILCPTQTAASRNQIRTYLGNKVGLSL